ncbi:MAG: hypothetical protein BMS9Abin37_1279 [Acidobacteriota bacterium]|nr:MAG: hypothetical protein BMS9Abin37_1279 [Acidobacteriota bacterium]
MRIKLRNRTPGDPLGQRLAFHELHRQELPATGFLRSVERGDVGVIELREELRFSFESFETFLVAQEFFRTNFDGNVSLELGVTGPINLTHATRTDGLDDFVTTEFGAG